MKVDLNSLNINQNIEKDMSSQGYSRDLKDQQIKSASRSGGFTLDINNSQTGLNDAAYKEEELKSADEIMMEAGQLDVALQRDYMTVMSNNMSKEDFAELCKDGFDLSNMSYEEQVTSLDKLKCKLAEAGMVVEGFNDDLSDEELNSITGNQALTSIIKEALRENDLPVNRENTEDITEALKKAESISAINDDKLKYMVLNKMEPTIGDLYMAEFSAGRSGGRQSKGYFRDETEGYFGKKAEVIDWEQIKDQAERIVKSAGIEADEEAMKEARWLVEEGIPLTKDTITTLNTLDNLKLPMKIRDCINQMAISISDGARAGEASLIKEKSYAGEAVDIKARVSELTSGELYKAVEADAPINIRSLTLYKEGEALNPEGSEAYTETVNSDKFITASRLLEETRLAMTTEANYRLLKSGISIDTLPLEDLVEKLKEAERDFYKPLLLDSENEGEKSNTDSLLDKRISLYKDSISVYESIKKVPLATLARVDDRGEEFTVSKVNDL
ncbi:MAG: DUF6240 domain-containing protein, partial [Lachnospiraceae bacterium]|nr:DUF6240 domain-containing protein [Lachnospiraceae bacterium]